MNTFRFKDLKIWQLGIAISNDLLDIADDLYEKKLWRFSDQLRGALMSITNNIAEGSGCESDREFAKFLTYSRRSVFEVANIMILLEHRRLISTEKLNQSLADLDELSRKIISFKRSLKL